MLFVRQLISPIFIDGFNEFITQLCVRKEVTSIKSRNIFKNSNKVAYALTAVVAGILTDLLYDVLAEESFQGTLINGTIQVIRVSKFIIIERIIIILILFLLLWFLLSFLVPLLVYCIGSLRVYNIPKLSAEKVLDTYKECKHDIIILQETVKNMPTQQDDKYVIIFNNICLIILKLHNVFCSNKKTNERIVKNSFRTGATVDDMGIKLSSYEFLSIVNIANQILILSLKLAPGDTNKLLNGDYANISKYLDDLKNLPVKLNIAC